MNKTFSTLIVAAVLSSIAVVPTQAQSDPAVVKVPFQFIVAGRVLPAGSYRIAPQTSDWAVVSISRVDGATRSTVVATQGMATPLATTDSKVTFVNYHGQYFLRTVVLRGTDPREVRISKSEAERTLAKLNLLGAEPADVAK